MESTVNVRGITCRGCDIVTWSKSNNGDSGP